MMSLCPFVDDSLDEAASLGIQLRKHGFPFEIRPLMPARTTSETYKLIVDAKPQAAIIDYYLTARPGTKSEELAGMLSGHGVVTVVVTKDRDVADRETIPYKECAIPVYYKHRLINDVAYIEKFLDNFKGQPAVTAEMDYYQQLYLLQEKKVRGTLSRAEQNELHTLIGRIRLEETHETVRLEQVQAKAQEDINSLVDLIKQLTAEFKEEIKTKRAIQKKRKRS